MVLGGCGAVVFANTRARETAVAITHGGDHVYHAASDAMAPALPYGAQFVTTSHFGTVRRGDVVMFNTPPGADPSADVLVKRVVGLPGETVLTQGGRLTINGVPLRETYIPAGVRTDCANYTNPCFSYAPIPADHYWVMGDNREHSRDSRYFGPIAGADIRAVAVRILSPPSAAGAVPGSTR